MLNDPSSLSVRHLRSATAERPFSESGTEGSNPVSSSGESGANLIFGGESHRWPSTASINVSGLSSRGWGRSAERVRRDCCRALGGHRRSSAPATPRELRQCLSHRLGNFCRRSNPRLLSQIVFGTDHVDKAGGNRVLFIDFN